MTGQNDARQTRSLSTKLLLLTILFVFLAEIVVLIPSIANQRRDWFEARIEAAYLVSLALENPNTAMMDQNVARQLFATANIRGVTVNHEDMRMLILAPEIDPHGPPRMHRVDLREMPPTNMVIDSWGTVFSRGDDLVQVTGSPQYADDNMAVDIIVSQGDLRSDLLLFGRNIFFLSLFISVLTASLVYWALNRMIVKPVKKLSHNMMAFEQDPENRSNILGVSNRRDEIGIAEHSLATMQQRLFDLLNERRRLAALGSGISKISHDLRNILASAQLMSDRLAKSEDPAVRKLSPRLVTALDRAIVLSRETLTYGGMDASKLDKSPVNLHALIDEVFEDTAAMGVAMNNEIAADFEIIADRTQLYRALFNLVKNAAEAIAPAENGESFSDEILGAVTVSVERYESTIELQIADSGAGLPGHAKDNLFDPFKGSQKSGGTGLGLAISSEIIRAHGGEIALAKSNETGTTFAITLPA
ncbi:MAG: HAMP domain-containing histidine kinase [Marinicaulis sp.]|nr:HAMP domain-containing histidine kinase [Marinicaulis sp.]NNL90328.1 HAMP domain-containing histidine kinase [Marinicaulis sp.]